MATLTGEQLKDSYQSLVTIGDSITSDPTSGRLENGKGTALTAVGIGTDAPAVKLHIQDGDSPTDGVILMSSSSNANDRVGLSYTYNADNDLDLHLGRIYSFQSGFQKDVTINTNGYVGINTDSPSEFLHIANTATALTVGLRIENSEGHVNLNTDGGGFDFETSASGTVATIDSSGNVGIGTSSNLHSNASRTTLSLNGSSSASYALGVAGTLKGFLYSDNSLMALQHTSGDILFEAGGSEKMRIDSSGNVGIGTSSPSAKFVVADSTNGIGMEVVPNGSDGGTLIEHYNRGTSAYTPVRKIASYHRFDISGSEEIRIDSDGLKFNGDTASANALDDYEEGTWTPAISSGYTSPTYTNTTGSYTKIGNVVNFTLRLELTGGTADGNQIKISGLPFTSSNDGRGSGVTIAFCNGTNYDGTQSLFIPPNITQIVFYEEDGTTFIGTEMSDNTWILHASGFYFT